jgi:hypothetical protein
MPVSIAQKLKSKTLENMQINKNVKNLYKNVWLTMFSPVFKSGAGT